MEVLSAATLLKAMWLDKISQEVTVDGQDRIPKEWISVTALKYWQVNKNGGEGKIKKIDQGGEKKAKPNKENESKTVLFYERLWMNWVKWEHIFSNWII